MMIAGEVKKSAYFDSITLMQCGKKIAAMAGIFDAAVVMGTGANRAILTPAAYGSPNSKLPPMPTCWSR